MATRKQIDWETIEKLYRTGQLSIREIARQHEINASSITKRAKRHHWARDVSEEVRQKTRIALLKQHRATERATATGNTPTAEDIDLAVQTNIEIVTTHRGGIANGQTLVSILHAQLKDALTNRDEIETAIEEDTKGAEGVKTNYKRRNQMLKAVSLPTHAGVLKDLSSAYKVLIGLERQAYNLNDKADGSDDAISQILDEVAKRAASIVSE